MTKELDPNLLVEVLAKEGEFLTELGKNNIEDGKRILEEATALAAKKKEEDDFIRRILGKGKGPNPS